MTVDEAMDLAKSYEHCYKEFGDLAEAGIVLAAEVRRLREENEDLNEGLTIAYMHGYDKAKAKYEQHLAEAVRECEYMVNDYYAQDIHNRWPEYFKEDT